VTVYAGRKPLSIGLLQELDADQLLIRKLIPWKNRKRPDKLLNAHSRSLVSNGRPGNRRRVEPRADQPYDALPMGPKQNRPKPGGVYASPLADGRYGVIRVLRVLEKSSLIAVSPWLGQEPPALDEPLLREILVENR